LPNAAPAGLALPISQGTAFGRIETTCTTVRVTQLTTGSATICCGMMISAALQAVKQKDGYLTDALIWMYPFDTSN
jgi:hypothetical protein